jgi:DNA modification methylase
MKLKDIKPNPNNPRVLRDDKFQKLKQSIKEFPKMLSLRPMVIDENNVVLGGNMRLRALQELGFTDIDEAWVKRSSDLTEEEKKRFIIADNVAFGEWDWDTLANDWEVVDLEAWGLEIPQFDTVEELEASEDDYEVPEGGIETDIVIGDLFEIGEHRLLCGDSTDSDAVARLMNGEKADMVFTDPPYGISIVGNNGKVGGDNKAKNGVYSKVIADETTDTAKDFYNTCISLGMENFIIWGGNYFTDFLPVSACWVIWDKENSGNFADVEIAWTSFDKGSKLYKWMWNGMSRKGSRELEGKTRVHPTQKPVGLFGDIFNDFPFQICFDGFLGSGSTMVAAHQLKRKCYGMELEPKYCQVIIDRMRKLDSSLIIKRNGKQI